MDGLAGLAVLIAIAAGLEMPQGYQAGVPRFAASLERQAACVLLAQAQPEQAPEPSLADVARKVRAERAKVERKPVKVFTNDNLPTGPAGISIVGAVPAAPTERSGSELAIDPESRHDAQYYARTMARLQAQRDVHQRELSVLQQKLNLAEPQYYSSPDRALEEQYSRTDLHKLTQEIEDKKQQIADDEKAIADLREQLRQEGGDPGWLRAAAAAVEQGASKAAEETQPDLARGAKAAKNSREYWRARFRAARERLKNASEEQQLAEDELGLLKTRQASELSAGPQSEIAEKIAAKQAEVEIKRATTAKAKQAIDALEREFKESGAPEEWNKGD